MLVLLGVIISFTSFYFVVWLLFQHPTEEEIESESAGGKEEVHNQEEEDEKDGVGCEGPTPSPSFFKEYTPVIATEEMRRTMAPCSGIIHLKEAFEVFGIEENASVEGNMAALKEIKEEIEKRKEEGKKGASKMRDYDSHSLPKEFIDLDTETFLMDPTLSNLCFLDKHFLIKICAMLSPSEFLKLSLTCRFLHWRLFTFCKCYVPTTIQAKIVDILLGHGQYHHLPQEVYYNVADCFNQTDFCDFTKEMYHYLHQGYRGIFVYQPPQLRKPFIFEELTVFVQLTYSEEEDYARCLPFVLSMRGRAHRLKVVLFYQKAIVCGPLFNYQATGKFLKAVKATSFMRWDVFNLVYNHYYQLHDAFMGNKDVYLSCPYARQMDKVWVDDLEEGPFLNRIGYYGNPKDEAVIDTFEVFLNGSKDLEFHAYYSIQEFTPNCFPLLSVNLGIWQDIVEYYCDTYGHIWYTTIFTNDGKSLVLRLSETKQNWVEILIGKESTFWKNELKYLGYYRYACQPGTPRFYYLDTVNEEQEVRRYSSIMEKWWKMETAIEGGEKKKQERLKKRKKWTRRRAQRQG